MPISKLKEGSLGQSSVTSDNITDGTIVNADISPSAAIANAKVPGIATLCTTATSINATVGAVEQNIALLGFKMAVNDGLTVFNLVDGVVDEFHDESGTDEAEGSNDLYNSTDDFYINSTQPQGTSTCISAGFSMTTITEPDTSTVGTNPTHGSATYGAFTVPTGVTSVSAFVFGAGGGRAAATNAGGAGGGFAKGTLGVTPGQALTIIVGEGGGTTCNTASVGAAPGGVTPSSPTGSGNGGAASGISTSPYPQTSQPTFMIVAGAGGSGGGLHAGPNSVGWGGPGGGLTGNAGYFCNASTDAREQTDRGPGWGPGGQSAPGGGGDQEQGGQGGSAPQGSGQSGSALAGGNGSSFETSGAGGGGYYGGGGSGHGPSPSNGGGGGGGGSSYYGHPQVTSGATEDGGGDGSGEYSTNTGCHQISNGGIAEPVHDPLIPIGGAGDDMGRGVPAATGPTGAAYGGDGFVLLTVSLPASTTSTTIVSEPFTSTSVPTTSRIVVFEENVATPTLNTDIIASISRDGGSTFTNATLSDSGYVTGSSGQRILTGQATISGQPSGQSMRWKLALANNAVKIHGVALQWS